MKKRSLITLLIAILMLCATSIPALAFELNTSDASVEGYYLYNIENDLIMAEHGADKAIFPSSTVKMMTGIIAIENITDTSLQITVTSDMMKQVSGRNMGLRAGDRLTLEDLLYATLCGGYNDAAIALAMSVTPTLSEFITLMNEKAAELGMTSTTYLNVTGTSASGMETTIYDMATLCRYLAQNTTFVDICATKSYSISSGATCKAKTVTNRSTLLAANKGMSNFNTGSSDGDCTVLYYKDGELSYIAIVMNAKAYDTADTTNYAEYFSKKLFGHAFNDYSYRTVYSARSVIYSMPVKYSISSDEIDLYLEHDLKLFLPNEIAPEDLTYSRFIYGDELEAPLKAGDTVGSLTVFYGDEILATVPLVVKETVNKNAFLYIIELMKDYLGGRPFLITLISFAILMVAFYILKKRKLQKMYKMHTASSQRSRKIR